MEPDQHQGKGYFKFKFKVFKTISKDVRRLQSS